MSDISSQLQAILGVPVLAMGDVMLDRFIHGRVERISPEAPIPVLRVERESAMLGGAGNVLRNLSALGADPQFLTVVGKDAAGRQVQELAGAELGGGARLLVDPGLTTTIKQRYISAGQQLLRSDTESERPPKPAVLSTLYELAAASLAHARALLLSDYGKGVMRGEEGLLSDLISAARGAGVPVVVDPKARDFSIYRGATFVTPNRRELYEATGLPVDSDDEVVAACRKLIADSGVEAVLATRSEQGMTLVAGNESVVHLPAEAREVYDVSGAGDTVVATFGAALAAGLPPEEAARIANLAAGIVVAKRGPAVAHAAEILRAAQTERLHSVESKVIDLQAAAEEAAVWRRRGLTVGFTNGCFDLLHPGHVSLLEQARAACDRLIVGLNSDASVKRLKGEDRPVQDEVARAAVLASLTSVDRVIVFGDDTPLSLLETLRPDVLVKGADYALEQVVGGDLVQGYGGRVVLADLVPGESTSATIRRMAR